MLWLKVFEPARLAFFDWSNAMRKLLIPVVILATAGLAVAAYALNSRGLADRPDCPGKVACPLTGELVCRDRCPLNKSEQTAPQDRPSCCRGGK